MLSLSSFFSLSDRKLAIVVYKKLSQIYFKKYPLNNIIIDSYKLQIYKGIEGNEKDKSDSVETKANKLLGFTPNDINLVL